MELDELKNIWVQYDKKITDNTRINKEILKRMLISKPEKRLNWIKIKAGFNLLSPIILVLIIFMDVKFTLTIYFYIGLSLFIALSVITYIWNIRYFLLIRKIDFSDTILSIKKGIVELEKYKIKISRIKYLIIAPFAMLAIFSMFFQKPIFNIESIVLCGLILIVFISSIYYTFKFSINEQFRKLDKEIAEIVELEKES
jgi:hypothetical protein